MTTTNTAPSGAAKPAATYTHRFVDALLQSARFRILEGWCVVAVYPNGLDLTRKQFGRERTIALRARADGWS